MGVASDKITIYREADVVRSATPPSDTSRVWIDTSMVPPTLKTYDVDKGEWTVPNEADLIALRTTIESHETKFETIDGQISTLISDTYITKEDGTVVSTKELYSQVIQDVDSLSSTVSAVQTSVDEQGTKIESVSTTATQTAEQFTWIVKSGTSASDFLLTDRVGALTAEYINLNGTVTFSGLSSEVKTSIDSANSNASAALQTASTAKIFALLLTSELVSVPTDSSGNGGVFSGIETTASCYFGSEDVSSSVTYSYSTSGVTVDVTNRTYTVTSMSGDSGYIDITASYRFTDYAGVTSTLTDTKRFTIVKNKQGVNGSSGEKGDTGTSVISVTAYFALSTSSTVSPTSGWVSTQPARSEGQYLWRKDLVAYSDGNSEYTEAYVVTGDKGDKGDTGKTGDAGSPAVSYSIDTSVDTITKNISNQLTPTSIEFTFYKSTGDSASKELYPGRCIIAESSDGLSWTPRYTSTTNESSYVYIPSSANISYIRCTLYAAGGTTSALALKTTNVVFDSNTFKALLAIENGVTVIDGSKILTGSIISQSIATGTITTDHIAANAIDASKLNIESVSAGLGLPDIGSRLTVVEGQISSKVWSSDITTAKNELGEDIAALETQYSQLDQTIDGISLSVTRVQEDFDNLSIGGTNLLLNTKSFVGSNIEDNTMNLDSAESSVEELYKDLTVKSYDNSGSDQSVDLVKFLDIYPENPGDVYTLSFYAKGSGTNTLVTHFSGENGCIEVSEFEQSTGGVGTASDGTSYWTITDSWDRYWVTWTLKDTGDTTIPKYILFDLLAGGIVSICGVKLEKGNKATDWSPAPEDNEALVDSVNSSLQNTIAEQSATLTTTYEGVLASALESYVLEEEYGSYKVEVESELEVMSDRINMNFASTTEQIDSINGELQSDYFTSLRKYINFSADGIIIGDDTGLTLSLDNDLISFSQNGTSFGSWDGNNFLTGNIEVRLSERAQFGNFAFVPRSDGSLMLLKVAG